MDRLKIDIDVPDGISGEWEVETFEVKDRELMPSLEMIKTGRGCVHGGTYKRLIRGGHGWNGVTVMSNTRDEIRDMIGFIYRAEGSILINGLGLGVMLKALLQKPQVTDITVIEISEDVMKLVAPYYNDPRLTIIHADCFTYEPPKGKKYDCVWHDIWDNICSDNLEEMKTLHRKYARKTGYQASWCRSNVERLYKQDKQYYNL
jgi:hypothetical protein